MTDGLSSMTGSGRGPRAVLWIVLLVLYAFGHGWATTVEPPDRPRVLVLHSYAPDYSWTRQIVNSRAFLHLLAGDFEPRFKRF